MENLEQNSFMESVISNNFSAAQRYFPRLSKCLMSYLMGENGELHNLKPENISDYFNVQHFLYHLCVVTEIQDDYVEAFEYFVSKLTDDELQNKNYLDFEDGYVYDYQINQNYFYLKLQDASFSFYEFFNELSDVSDGFNFKKFKDFTLNLLNSQLKAIDMSKKMYSNEYVEIYYMQAIIKVLNDTKHLDELITKYSSNC